MGHLDNLLLLLLLLLSHFSRVPLCATPQTAAHQDPPSLGFSRQEHWSGLPFPSPVHESESEIAQPSPTPSSPMDCSLPGSSVRGIFQTRVPNASLRNEENETQCDSTAHQPSDRGFD